MNLKPTNPSEMIGFIKAVISLWSEIDKDLETQLVVSETEKAFIVDCTYIAELNKEGEAIRKEADMSFSWLKEGEELEQLNKYIADLENELSNVLINYNGFK